MIWTHQAAQPVLSFCLSNVELALVLLNIGKRVPTSPPFPLVCLHRNSPQVRFTFVRLEFNLRSITAIDSSTRPYFAELQNSQMQSVVSRLELNFATFYSRCFILKTVIRRNSASKCANTSIKSIANADTGPSNSISHAEVCTLELDLPLAFWLLALRCFTSRN